MLGSLAAKDVSFLPLPTAVFCVQCELISSNNTPRCLACGSKAVLSLSRILGGSLRGQQTAHLIADVELNQLVRSLLFSVPDPLSQDEHDRFGHTDESQFAPSFAAGRHHMRLRQPRPVALAQTAGSRHIDFNPGELDLEPGISIIAEKAQSLTVPPAQIALRKGNEIVQGANRSRLDLSVSRRTLGFLPTRPYRGVLVSRCRSNPGSTWLVQASGGTLGLVALRHFRRTLGVFQVLSSAPHALTTDVATMQFLSG
jgi:hypothetical protein